MRLEIWYIVEYIQIFQQNTKPCGRDKLENATK